jgi:2-polyprenyl-6-methoxyphenol hydroxylase-like FAD-dependent oxidoreductase
MCGIAMKHAGHDVRIIERDSDERQSHMAGICLGRDCQQFLKRHDNISEAFTLHSEKIQVLNQQGTTMMLVSAQRDIATWDALYYRLRANFDGYSSKYYPVVPSGKIDDGPAVYTSSTNVLDVTKASSGNEMVVTLENRGSNKTSTVHADLVVGADGPSSYIREKYVPTAQETYGGYIVWRGLVPERVLSAETVRDLSEHVNVFMKSRTHCLSYMVPGVNGSLQPGERFLNFAWYTNQTPLELNDIMIDSQTGHRHRRTVPCGRIRTSVWEKQLRLAQQIPFPEPFLEVLVNIDKPFVQVIHELQSSKAVFEDGKVVLIGDGLSSLRPHTAFSASQAAFHVMELEHSIFKGADLQTWQTKVLRFGYLHCLQSWWFGNFYQSRYSVCAVSAMWYWAMRLTDTLEAWWTGEEALLRT